MKKVNKRERCRHERNSWIICGGYAEWCYVCGAWRKMRPEPEKAIVYPMGKWNKPSGDKDINPYIPPSKTISKIK